jgi:hypothetical protein
MLDSFLTGQAICTERTLSVDRWEEVPPSSWRPPGGGNWAETILHPFASTGAGPYGSLNFDSGGNLYGTTFGSGADGLGNVFKLTHSNGGWTYVSLHDFTGQQDGKSVYGNVVIDTNGNVYGTASLGGSQSLGVVWVVTP